MNPWKEIIETEWNQMIEETFSQVSGQYLDRGTSLLETLGTLSAERVSRPSPGNGETVAAHVFHLLFYLDVLEEYVAGTRTGKTDWAESWTVSVVDEAGWAGLRERLRSAETRLRSAAGWDWAEPDRFGGLLTMLVHTAFHLGALRQVLDVTA